MQTLKVGPQQDTTQDPAKTNNPQHLQKHKTNLQIQMTHCQTLHKGQNEKASRTYATNMAYKHTSKVAEH